MPWIRVVTESNNHIVYWNGFIGKKKKDSKENDVYVTYDINLDNQCVWKANMLIIDITQAMHAIHMHSQGQNEHLYDIN